MRPHRSTVIAVVALVFSMTGGAIAAVNYARNAGAVDGYSAVKADSSNRKAAGKLVAMDVNGRLPFKFLDGSGASERGSQLMAVPDNSASTPVRIVGLKLGSLSASCFDQQETAGIENPATRFYVTNHSGASLDVAYRAGSGQGAAETLPAGGAVSFVVGGQAFAQVQLQNAETSVIAHGGARQTGQGTPDGSCAAFATALFAGSTG